MPTPLLIAHRGDTNNFPENTLDAFASAFEKGADGVEMDVQLMNGAVRVVHNMTADPTGEYPLLEEVLENFVDRGRLEIEIKAFSAKILEPLQRILAQYPSADIELTTSELPLVPFITAAFPSTSIGVIFSAGHYQDWMSEELYVQKVVGHMKLLRAHVVHLGSISPEQLTASFVDALHEQGLRVHFHIPRAEEEAEQALYRHLQQAGVDQCTFDDIELLSP